MAGLAHAAEPRMKRPILAIGPKKGKRDISRKNK
jgi:hypothetical protein